VFEEEFEKREMAWGFLRFAENSIFFKKKISTAK